MVNDDDLDQKFWPTDTASYEEYPTDRYDKYCPLCDFKYGEPDDCLCDSPCGVIGCQGVLNTRKSAPK